MRVGLYERVSTEEQSLHGLSIDAQKAVLSEWAKDKVVVDHYTDLGVSARKPILKRPELQRLLRDVEAEKIDVIAFTRLDRWTRNIREYYKAQDVLDAHGVAWRALQEDYETETAAGRLKVNIMLAVAQDEADRTSERIKAVFDDKRRRGLVTTGSVPLGVKIESGKYVPSDDAPKVKQIFLDYIASRSARFVAKQYGYTAEGMTYLLKNHNYLDSGVIDRKTWEATQNILISRSQRHVRSDRVYLFSGLLFCRCGSRMACSTVSRNGKTYIYYRCIANQHGKACSGTNVSESKVERFLLDNTIKKVEEVNLHIVTKQKTKPDIKKIKARQDKLTDLYLNDLVSREKYEIEYRELQAALSDAENEPSEIDAEEIKTLLEAYYDLSREEKKAFWSNLIERIDVNDGSFYFTISSS